MRISDTSDLWWKTAVIYCLDVQTFMDWNDDGMGDFTGLAERLDYLADLGVTCLWLMPFHPTTDRDDGYDITDYYGVDPRLGSAGDFVEVVRTARDRGMRVIIDLVVNHTSDQHPWFQAARSSKTSPYRDFYVWRADEPPDTTNEVVVPGPGEQHLGVRREDRGVVPPPLLPHPARPQHHQPPGPRRDRQGDGLLARARDLRLPGGRRAVHARDRPVSTQAELDRFPDPHEYLRHLRSFVGRRTGDGILLGEVNLPHKDQKTFFGGKDGDELTMQFDFIGMQNLYLSLARQDARPLARALRQRPADLHGVAVGDVRAQPRRAHPRQALRPERDEVFAAFGPDPEMQLYGRGLRRRLPPMLDGDPRRIRMVYSLLFSLPGTPVLFYGEEIGMGENLDIDGRLAVRTPMQWTDGAQRRLLERRAVAAAATADGGRLRSRARQRRGPASDDPTRSMRSSPC